MTTDTNGGEGAVGQGRLQSTPEASSLTACRSRTPVFNSRTVNSCAHGRLVGITIARQAAIANLQLHFAKQKKMSAQSEFGAVPYGRTLADLRSLAVLYALWQRYR